MADVKGNLNIGSLQDKATFDSKNEGISASATVGYGASVSGSVNLSKMLVAGLASSPRFRRRVELLPR